MKALIYELAKLTSGEAVERYDGSQNTAQSDYIQVTKLNGTLKGRTAWWLWSVLADWNPED